MGQIVSNVENILWEAVEISSPTERQVFLEKACAGDTLLRERLERLVACHHRAGAFLEHPVAIVDADNTTAEPQPKEGPGTQIGPYKIIEQIGEGGMGLVYMAEQQQPLRRLVALKVIKPGMDTRQVVSRFEAERQALAMMDHPNIARIFDAGTTGGESRDQGPGTRANSDASPTLGPRATTLDVSTGRPYFVMELVRGVPITPFCDQKQLNVRERLKLFLQVCQAVQHAHQKGIIHRDLKPTNVLVTMHDVAAVPKVIDFGVAKALGARLTEQTLYTGFSQLVGTPLYMSPEQAELNEIGVDTRSDIYSLGVLLYELLTGMTPFDKETLSQASFDEMRRIIREVNPPLPSQRLSTLHAQANSTHSNNNGIYERRSIQHLRGELDWIVMKSLEKDRNRRYDSASALAADIQRFLADEPILARPASAWYRGRKWIHRHRASAVVAVMLLITVTLLGGLFFSWRRSLKYGAAVQALTQQQQLEDESERLVRASRYPSKIAIIDAGFKTNPQQAIELLNELRPPPGGKDLRGFEWYYLWDRVHREPKTWQSTSNSVFGLDISPDGRTLAAACAGGSLEFWDIRTGKVRATLPIKQGNAYCVAFSPDGTLVAGGGSEDEGNGQLRMWHEGTGDLILEASALLAPVNSVQFTSDSKSIVLSTGKIKTEPASIQVWNVATRQRDLLLPSPENVNVVRISPDGHQMILAGRDVCSWDLATGEHRWQLPRIDGVGAYALASGAEVMACGRRNGMIQYIEPATGKEIATWKGHTKEIWALAFSPDGRFLATGGVDPRVKLWDTESRQNLAEFSPGAGVVRGLEFTTDGRWLAIGREGGAIHWWAIPSSEKVGDHAGEEAWDVAFSPDGESLVSVGDNAKSEKSIFVWNVRSGRKKESLSGHASLVSCVAYAPNGRTFATGSYDLTIKLWDADTLELQHIFRGHTAPVRCIAFSPDGRFMASGSRDRTLRIWDVFTAEQRWCLQGHDNDHPKQTFTDVTAVEFSADGNTLAASSNDHTIKFWRLDELTASGDPTPWRLIRDDAGVSSLSFSSDGRTLATGNNWGVVKLWDTQTGDLRSELLGHSDRVRALVFSPDGRTLASASADHTILLWHSASGQHLLKLRGHSRDVNSLMFSPDGQILVSASHDGDIRRWNAPRDDQHFAETIGPE